MVKLLVGLIKGAVIGAGVGFGAWQLDKATGFFNSWLTFGVIGALVGLVCGQAIWALLRDTKKTNYTAIVKAVFGFGVGCGLYALVARVWGGFDLTLGEETRVFHDWQPVFAASVGGFLGAFFEIDDAIGGDKTPETKPVPAAPAKVAKVAKK